MRSEPRPVISVVSRFSWLWPSSGGRGQPDFGRSRPRKRFLVALRRWLHLHPELSMRERGTQAKLRENCERFRDWNGSRETGHRPGLRAPRSEEGPLLAYRADIDALPCASHRPLLRFDRRRYFGRRPVGSCTPAATTCTPRPGRVARLSPACAERCAIRPLRSRAGEEIGAGAPALIQSAFSSAAESEAIYAIHVHPTVPFGR